MHRAFAVLSLVVAVASGCASARHDVKGAPSQPFDALVVPGCPCNDDGSLTRCQMARAGWAAMVWQRGWARHVIVSGAAVHSPYVEAEAIAEAMTLLGVPADKIYLEPDALHTDENMYNSLQIARLLGLRTVAATGEWGGPRGSCEMMESWGQPCRALPADFKALVPKLDAARPRLDRIRARRVDDFVSLAERERLRAARTGRPRRPPSWLLYLSLAQRRSEGKPWIPFAAEHPVARTWAQHLAQRAAEPSSPGSSSATGSPASPPAGAPTSPASP